MKIFLYWQFCRLTHLHSLKLVSEEGLKYPNSREAVQPWLSVSSWSALAALLTCRAGEARLTLQRSEHSKMDHRSRKRIIWWNNVKYENGWSLISLIKAARPTRKTFPPLLPINFTILSNDTTVSLLLRIEFNAACKCLNSAKLILLESRATVTARLCDN